MGENWVGRREKYGAFRTLLKGLRRRIRTARWRPSFYSPTRVALVPMLPPTMQQASSHSQLPCPTMQQASTHLQLERQTVASFGGGGLIYISKISCSLSSWCITIVVNTTDIVMCYEQRVRSLPPRFLAFYCEHLLVRDWC